MSWRVFLLGIATIAAGCLLGWKIGSLPSPGFRLLGLLQVLAITGYAWWAIAARHRVPPWWKTPALAWLAREFWCGYESCYCCRFPWPPLLRHSTHCSDPEFVAEALCESCWLRLRTPEARLPYYRALVKHWQERELPEITGYPSPEFQELERKLAAIVRAVKAGL